MRYIYSAFFAIVFAALIAAPASAQDAYMDLQYQISNNGRIEHYVFWKEYKNAMDSNNSSRAMAWWGDSNVLADATTAAYRMNQAKPLRNVDMYNVPTNPDAADLQIRQGGCPGIPNALGCFSVDLWYNMSTHSVYTWQKATIWIKPSVSGVAEWTTDSRVAAIEHEIGHAYGLGEQYLWSGCNANVLAIMDGGGINPTTHKIYHCDGIAYPQSWDMSRWSEYKHSGYYLYSYNSMWGDGTVVTYWIDRFWNDYMTEVDWQWGNSASGPWTAFVRTSHVGFNGSHSSVSDANGLRINAWVNPGFYGIHQKYLRVCARAVLNYIDVQPWQSDHCTSIGFYPY